MQQRRVRRAIRSPSPLQSINSTPSLLYKETISNSSTNNRVNSYIPNSQSVNTHEAQHSPAVIPRRFSNNIGKTQDNSYFKNHTGGGLDTASYIIYNNELEAEVVDLQRRLRLEYILRQAAERRTLEERENGVRAAIVIEANYGARLLYSIFVEAMSSLSRNNNNSNNNNNNIGNTQWRPIIASTRNNEKQTLVEDYDILMKENKLLRAQVEQYKSIESQDRQELNELHRNMRAVIDQLTQERDMLLAERENGKLSLERKQIILPARDASLWHYKHIIDPSAANTEESSETGIRLRVRPLSTVLMVENRSIALKCWDACLHYELAQDELWSRFISEKYINDFLTTNSTPSISDKTVIIAIRHICTELKNLSKNEIIRFLYTFKKEGNIELCSNVMTNRVSIQVFILLLESLTLENNAVRLLENLWRILLQNDSKIIECLEEEEKKRTTIELKQNNDWNQLTSSWRRDLNSQRLRERLEQNLNIANIRSMDNENIGDQREISLIRRAVRVEQKQEEEYLIKEASRVERLGNLFNSFETIHDQLDILKKYESLSFSSLRNVQTELIFNINEKINKGGEKEEKLYRLERQIGILGRFAIGFSLMNIGRREHDAILHEMHEITTTSLNNNNNNNNNNSENNIAGGDFTWLIEDNNINSDKGYCASTSLDTTNLGLNEISILEYQLSKQKEYKLQYMFDKSCYKVSETLPNNNNNNRWIIPSENECYEIEEILRRTFFSLTKLNYIAFPFLQIDANILDNLILFPSFELFMTQCEMNFIGSCKLTFMRHCSENLNPEIANYIKSLVRLEGNWIADYAMNYNDFLSFLLDQACVENIRQAYLMSSKDLLIYIVKNIVLPKWLSRLKEKNESSNLQTTKDIINENLFKISDSNDFCVLLDIAVTWLEIASLSLKNFALAYRKNVINYPFATKPEKNQSNFTTTEEILKLLFLSKDQVKLNCNMDRLEVLKTSYGHSFLEMSELIGNDGSLDSVSAWFNLAIEGINREELMEKISSIIITILYNLVKNDSYYKNDRHFLNNISYNTPISWIFTLVISVKLSINNGILKSSLVDLFRNLTVST